MRGRKPRSLRIVPHDAPILQEIARSRSLPWYQIQRAQNRPGRRRRGADPTLGRSDTARSLDHLEGLPPLRGLGPVRPPGPAATDRATRPDFPPSRGLRSSDWPAWSRSPRDCTSPTGRARIWPAKRSKTASSRPSATGRSDDPQRGGPPTAPHTVLADGPNRCRVQAEGGEGPLVLCERRSAGQAGLLGGLC